MTAPVIAPMSATSVNRKWYIQVDTNNNVLSPNWVSLEGVTSVTPAFDNANLAEDTDQAGQGAESQVKTSYSWSVSGSCRDAGQFASPTSEPVAQAYLRAAAETQVGPANSVRIRVFEYDANDPAGTYSPRAKAYQGTVAVQWVQAGGDMKSLAMWNFTLTGQGKLNKIAHPVPLVAAVPTVTSVSPNSNLTRGGGQLVNIQGTGFTTTIPTTGVKFGTVNASQWIVESDTLIVAQTPAQSAAGPVTVTVTNSAGASTSAVQATYA